MALTKCYYCLKDDAIMLATRYGHDGRSTVNVKARYHGKVVSMEPCNECREWMKRGVILITIDDSKSTPGWNKETMPNPYRTGGFAVVTTECIERMIKDETMKQWALKHRWMFIEHDAAVQCGIIKP